MWNLHFLMELVNNKNEMPSMQKENKRKNKQKPSHNLIKRSTINAYNHQQLETARRSQWLEYPTPLPSSSASSSQSDGFMAILQAHPQ